jgi:hypothetical protein
VSAVSAVTMAGKRSSGAKRRAYAQAVKSGAFFGLLRPGKPGRPKGPTDEVQNRLSHLQRDLAWIGRPDLSDLAIARMLQKTREYAPNYEGVSERTLRRDVAMVQRKIWGPKKLGAK